MTINVAATTRPAEGTATDYRLEVSNDATAYFGVPPRTHDDGRAGTVVLVTGAPSAAGGAPGASVCVIVIGASYSNVGRGRHATMVTASSTSTTVHRMIAPHSARAVCLQPCQARRAML